MCACMFRLLYIVYIYMCVCVCLCVCVCVAGVPMAQSGAVLQVDGY